MPLKISHIPSWISPGSPVPLNQPEDGFVQPPFPQCQWDCIGKVSMLQLCEFTSPPNGTFSPVTVHAILYICNGHPPDWSFNLIVGKYSLTRIFTDL